MQPGRIFITIIVLLCLLGAIFLIHNKEWEKRLHGITASNQPETASPSLVLPPEISENYRRIATIGYGFATDKKTGSRKMGITFDTENQEQSLIPISQEDIFLLTTFHDLLKNMSDDPTIRAYATFILHRAQELENTEFVSFENNETCQARFHKTHTSTCVNARDAVAICMVFAKIRVLHLFAHKDLFSREYWESLFEIQV